jgi:acyl dehydratase
VKITDAGIDKLKARIGAKISNQGEPWCYEATRDNIRHYAHGIGDDNPLWCDPNYASQSVHGGIVALPSFLFTTSKVISGNIGGLPGVHTGWAGSDWTWYKWIKRNDEINTEAYLKDVIEHETEFAGRAVQQIYHVDFYNQHGDMVAEADSWVFRNDRDKAREGKKYAHLKDREPLTYTQEQLNDAYQLYRDEKIRGSQILYWDDVNVNDTLPTMLKGPMTVTGFITYVQGSGGLFLRSNKLAFQLLDSIPSIAFKNKHGIPDVPERVHWEEELALNAGTPGVYDFGNDRAAWLMHQLTNYMGDTGFLHKAECKIRRHNPVGDLLYIKGVVTRKFIENEKHYVEIQQEGRNQYDELSIVGSGIVELPKQI